jgi:hypothetical protein
MRAEEIAYAYLAEQLDDLLPEDEVWQQMAGCPLSRVQCREIDTIVAEEAFRIRHQYVALLQEWGHDVL